MSSDQRTWLQLAGGATAVAVFIIVVITGGAAWRAWLAAAALTAGTVVGATVMAATVRLIPGRWRAVLETPLAREVRALPAGALAMAPILVAPALVYAWTGEAGSGFRGGYLTPTAFLIRGVSWFALLGLAAWGMRRSRRQAAPVLTVLALTPLSLLIATDWLMSLDPDYASSGYGLYLLSLEAHLALSLAVVQVAARASPAQRDALGGVLFTVLAIWGYLGFMPFFINWSENLPEPAGFFQRRGGDWAILSWTAIALKAGPGAALIFGHVRRSAKALRGVALSAMAGAVCEIAWLVLPAPGPPAALGDVALYLAAVAALGAFGFGLSQRRPRLREAAP